MSKYIEKAKSRVTLSIGPGWHHEQLISQLTLRGVPLQIIYSWPKFRVFAVDTDSVARHLVSQCQSYDRLVHIIWGSWRRIPYLQKFETPRVLTFALYDLLASRFPDREAVFHGWSQVSLRSMRRAKRLKSFAILEHPMLHVNAWQSEVTLEYERYGRGAKGYYSLMPTALVRRMKLEYVEANRIIVPSRLCEASFISNGIAEEKLIRIPFGVNTSFFSLKRKGKTDNFRVLYVGRLEFLKGIQYLLKAWDILKLGQAELVLVGRVLPEVEPLLEKYSADSVRVVGNVAQDAMPGVYQSADVVVFPSICDAFALVILEAMASGVPVIASDHTGGPDIITDGEDGFIVPARDADAIADRIQWVHHNRLKGIEMGLRAREKVMRCFTWERYGTQIIESYRANIGNVRS